MRPYRRSLTSATHGRISESSKSGYLSETAPKSTPCREPQTFFHMAGYWEVEHNPNPTHDTLRALIEGLINNCPEFLFVRDVANASKHNRLTTNPKPPRRLSSSDDVRRTPGLFEAPFGEGVFNEAVEVIVTLDDGTSRPLAPIVRAVLSMWESMF